MTDSVLFGFGFFIGLTAIGVYFIPTMIAFARYHNNKIPIFLLNLFLGWTFIGWVGALVWSTTSTGTKE